jgi:hypothetical protein
MPIRDYSGRTFVAFTDIAGFKAMMTDGDRAPRALNDFYQTGFSVISKQDYDGRVEGLFISDCGVLFVRRRRKDPIATLNTLLAAVEELNWRCFRRAVSLTTSIAWGEFSYHERIEIPGIEKNPVYGNAYVTAYLDNESGTPKLYPNECRIIKRELPEEVNNYLVDSHAGPNARKIRDAAQHFYFEWMREPPVLG